MQAQITPCVRERMLAREEPDRVEISDAMEAVLEAHQLLLGVMDEPSPFRAMALMMATRSTHGRMQRLLSSLETEGRVDDKALARAREWLNLFAEALRVEATDHYGTVDRCSRYLAAAQGELQRLGKAVVATAWRRSCNLPGYTPM